MWKFMKTILFRGVNRIVATNWNTKFPAELYRDLFRFEKSDIGVLIAALEVPDTLQFENGYQSNRYL